MARTMVHSKTEVQEFTDLIVLTNVPFESIPRGFIEYREGYPYPYEEFEKYIKFFNQSGAYWNLVTYKPDGQPIAVVWGTWDPLDRYMRVLRVTIHPYSYRTDGEFLKWLLNQVRRFASAWSAKRLFWESSRWEAWLRKLGGFVYVDETRVVQVY